MQFSENVDLKFVNAVTKKFPLIFSHSASSGAH